MADFSISGSMKVKTLKKNFKEQFGSNIRVYNGVKFASDDDTVGKIAKKTVKRGEDVSANGRTLVGNFEKQMSKIYGIKIQVATRDDSELVGNDISLTQSGKI